MSIRDLIFSSAFSGVPSLISSRMTSLGMNDGWAPIIFGDGRYVIASYLSDNFAYSTKTGGVTTWTTSKLPQGGWLEGVYGGGKFIFYSGSSCIISNDGVNFVRHSIPAPVQNIAYGNGVFVASSGSSDSIAYSSDGINWTTVTLPNSGQYISFGNGVFVRCGIWAGVARVNYSTDGINWTTASSTPSGFVPNTIVAGDSGVLLLSNSEAVTTKDFITWAKVSLPARLQSIWSKSAFGSGFYAATDANFKLLYSNDLVNFELLDIHDKYPSDGGFVRITYGDNAFAMVQHSGDKVYEALIS